MFQNVLILIGIVIIAILLTKKTRERVVGICSSALDQTVRKNANKEKIMTLLQKGSASARGSGPLRHSYSEASETKELSNHDIRETLGISERSVVRYMDELEKEGKVEQVGSTGRGVIYRLK